MIGTAAREAAIDDGNAMVMKEVVASGLVPFPVWPKWLQMPLLLSMPM